MARGSPGAMSSGAGGAPAPGQACPGNTPPPNIVGVPVYGRTGIGATSGSLGASGAPLRAEALAGQGGGAQQVGLVEPLPEHVVADTAERVDPISGGGIRSAAPFVANWRKPTRISTSSVVKCRRQRKPLHRQRTALTPTPFPPASTVISR